MQYDARNRLVRKVDKNGNVTRTVYDGNNNVVMTINALGETVQMKYDDGAPPSELTDAKGNTSTRTYDAVGRLLSGNRRPGQHHASRVRRSRQCRRQLRRGRPAHLLDRLQPARPQRHRQHGRSGECDGDALRRAVAPDRDHRCSRPVDQARLRQARPPRPLRRRVGAHVDAGVLPGRRRAVDDRRQRRPVVFQLRRSEPHSAVHARRARFCNLGATTSAGCRLAKIADGGRKNFEYDDAGRLTGLTYTGDGARPDRAYAYDDNGNLTTVRSGGSVQLRRTFDALNRATSFTDAHGDTLRYAYDANGNFTKLTYPDGKAVTYNYDEANRLIEVVDWACAARPSAMTRTRG
ncbi:MAG: hypothetical protein R2748_30635 [Bryobacterales bacterium]